jgi:hypothetical protein
VPLQKKHETYQTIARPYALISQQTAIRITTGLGQDITFTPIVRSPGSLAKSWIASHRRYKSTKLYQL